MQEDTPMEVDDGFSIEKMCTALQCAPTWLERLDNTMGLSASITELSTSRGILVVGQMGAGKSSLINSIIGEHIFPMCEFNNDSPKTDTMCFIEFVNQPELDKGIYDVEVVLNHKDLWTTMRNAFLSSLDQTYLRISRSGKIGVKMNKDPFQALHKSCFHDVFNEDHQHLKQHITNPGSAQIRMSNDDVIFAALAMPKRRVRLTSREAVLELLTRLCRAYASEKDWTRSALTGSVILNTPQALTDPIDRAGVIGDLLTLGDPWPLVRIVRVSANFLGRGALPPFCRLLDSPGFGERQSTVFTSLESLILPGSVTEVWYLIPIARSSNNPLSMLDLEAVIRFAGIDKVKFVVTKIDTSMGLIINEEEREEFDDLLASELLQYANNPSETVLKKILDNLHFVSALGFAAVMDIALPGLDPEYDIPKFKRNFNPLERTGLPALLSNLRTHTLQCVENLVEQLKYLVHQSLNHCSGVIATEVGTDSQLDRVLLATRADPVVLQANETAQSTIDSLQIFLQRVCIAASTEPMYRSVQENSISDVRVVLSPPGRHLNPSIFRAVLTRLGEYNLISIPKVIQKSVFEAIPNFTDEWEEHFKRVQEATENLLLMITTKLTSIMPVLTQSLIQETALNFVRADLRAARQMLASHHSLSLHIHSSKEFKPMWLTAEMAMISKTVGKKMKTATESICESLRGLLPSILNSAGIAWSGDAKMFLEGAIHRAPSRLLDCLRPYLISSTQDSQKVLQVLHQNAKVWMTPEQWVQLCNIVNIIPTIPSTPAPAMPDHHWISVPQNNTYLLFRGLCGLVPDQTNPNTLPVMMFPHQYLLQEICASPSTEFSRTLATTSAFATLEAAIDGASESGIDSFDPLTLNNLFTQSGSVAKYLTVDSLLHQSEKIRNAMVATDKLDHREAFSTAWKYLLHANKFRRDKEVRHDRQELYTNRTWKFLSLWKLYADRYAVNKNTEFPWSALAFSDECRSWFHWRWCFPKGSGFGTPEFRLLGLGNTTSQVHPNPFLSCSQSMEHAIKYAAGRKAYCAGQAFGNPPRILYNADRSCVNPELILGVIVIMQIKKDYVTSNADKINVVLQLLRNKLIKVQGDDRRIGSEEEVTLYGGLPTEAGGVFHIVPLRAFDCSRPENTPKIDGRLIPKSIWEKICQLALHITLQPNDDAVQDEMRIQLSLVAGWQIQYKLDTDLHINVQLKEDKLKR